MLLKLIKHSRWLDTVVVPNSFVENNEPYLRFFSYTPYNNDKDTIGNADKYAEMYLFGFMTGSYAVYNFIKYVSKTEFESLYEIERKNT